MVDLNKHQRRLDVKGTSMGNGLSNMTQRYQLGRFADSPTYRRAKVYQENESFYFEVDVRVNIIDRMSSIRYVLLKPYQDIKSGSILEFDGNKWLVYEKYGDAVSSHLRLTVQRINFRLNWINEDRVFNSIPCIVTKSYLGSNSRTYPGEIQTNSYDVNFTTDSMMVFVEKTELTDDIVIGTRFILSNNVYMASYIDNMTDVDGNGEGVTMLSLTLDEKKSEDDFISKIAYNRYPSGDGYVEVMSDERQDEQNDDTAEDIKEEEVDDDSWRMW